MTEDAGKTAFERAQAALEEKWAGERAQAALPKERYMISFRSGWRGCGEVMEGVGWHEDDLEDIEWHLGDGRHRVFFTCTWPVLKDLQATVKGSYVRDMHCTRA